MALLAGCTAPQGKVASSDPSVIEQEQADLLLAEELFEFADETKRTTAFGARAMMVDAMPAHVMLPVEAALGAFSMSL